MNFELEKFMIIGLEIMFLFNDNSFRISLF